jgi:D-alanyl-D-alanine dipeptidase
MLLGDRALLETSVVESGERFVDLSGVPWMALRRPPDDRVHWTCVREGVAVRLERAAASLPDGLRFKLYEGYRSPELQAKFYGEREAAVRSAQPSLSNDEVRVEASAFVAPPDVAPHATGGAVDLTLCSSEAHELDLGTTVNMPPENCGGACHMAAHVSAVARHNRALLTAALGAAGFVNYPPEWWHWSFGDRYWAATTGSSAQYEIVQASKVRIATS